MIKKEQMKNLDMLVSLISNPKARKLYNNILNNNCFVHFPQTAKTKYCCFIVWVKKPEEKKCKIVQNAYPQRPVPQKYKTI